MKDDKNSSYNFLLKLYGADNLQDCLDRIRTYRDWTHLVKIYPERHRIRMKKTDTSVEFRLECKYSTWVKRWRGGLREVKVYSTVAKLPLWNFKEGAIDESSRSE